MLQDNNGSSNGHNGANGHAQDKNENVIHFPAGGARNEKPPKPPMLNLPPVTKLMLGVFIVIHAVVFLIGLYDAQLKNIILIMGGFLPASWSGTLPFVWWTPLTLLSFSVLHGSWLHIIVNGVMLLAMGSPLEKWLGWRRMLVIYAGSSLIAVLCHLAFNLESTNVVIGASGGLSGYFGGLLLLLRQGHMINNRNNSIMPIIMIWLAITIIFGMMGSPDGADIAWLGHVGGFFGGLGITWLMLGRPSLRN